MLGWPARIVLFASIFLASLGAQNGPEEYRVYSEHPRLLLKAQRLRLLRRERDRQTIRWQQFQTLIAGKAAMPEPGFAWALYYQVSGDTAVGKQAVQWALGPKASDLRQLALVFDWCQGLLDDTQRKALAAKLQHGLGSLPANLEVTDARSRVFASIALADHGVGAPDTTLQNLVERWWRGSMQTRLQTDAAALARTDLYALYELLHAVRDNINIDLREGANIVFQELPAYAVLRNYPAPYPAPENEYYVPFFDGNTEPDLTAAVRSRAAGLSIVAYDTNAVESQFLQGWLMRDQLMMKSAFGAPYEFFWANQYQPGLSYDKLPLLLHIRSAGLLIARSDWDENAIWFVDLQGKMQIFTEGKRQTIDAVKKLVTVGPTGIIGADLVKHMNLETGLPDQFYVVGLRPGSVYSVEIDDEELREETADRAGMIAILIKDRAGSNLYVRERQAR